MALGRCTAVVRGSAAAGTSSATAAAPQADPRFSPASPPTRPAPPAVLLLVQGCKRCYDPENGYTFVYPANWLADQTLYRRYAQRIEAQSALDPPPLGGGGGRRPRRNPGEVAEPSAAYGPPGSTGEENLSVIVAPIRDGFTLQRMGTPAEAAARFLAATVAPEGSDRQAQLLGAGSFTDEAGELYYYQEFTVK